MDKKRIVVFIGPSLSLNQARKILDAEYHPPVARDDVAILLNDPPDIIGIIDGVFHQQPAVSHREILHALEAGVIIVGGSSMGALRSAELDYAGMIGIGKVYQNYRDGVIESDDDVAIVFNPETHELLSEALVSMNHNFQMAEKDGIITSSDVKNLYETAKKIYYPQRTYTRVLKDSKLDKEKKKTLNSYLDNKGIDIKEEDAKKVLEYIKELI
ncbi:MULTISPECIES: TfuA-related McrA-glycine thioamidation protein [Methanobacterium]|uniref:TfuA domain protein core n=1 Tax=Methanobacterium subterraneum TaxID=59277 RepID=A0A2H4VMF1_9EURY|nr:MULTISPECIES: TfuA-related McrA-glycine thioamidation protein [Methanobacterium]AUB58286.1 TfuA domain protein core [Methanobacterium sp. MZ-A1]AUB59264.1 TfuA domain protein core [Methanobacterium subterraneum]MBW4256945.1 TfuA-related McrA-glycine thioamidation protein [Methanobacterium sp. YSL]NMO08820.1 TfuA-related McrA-glycine thioamidation protein [Methanobacterium subterraneum]